MTVILIARETTAAPTDACFYARGTREEYTFGQYNIAIKLIIINNTHTQFLALRQFGLTCLEHYKIVSYVLKRSINIASNTFNMDIFD